ncbi:MAG TPA: aminotransferase class IV [Acidimicrobiales bacterium]
MPAEISDVWWVDGVLTDGAGLAGDPGLRHLVGLTTGLVPRYWCHVGSTSARWVADELATAVGSLGAAPLPRSAVGHAIDGGGDAGDLVVVSALPMSPGSGYPALGEVEVVVEPADPIPMPATIDVVGSPWPRTVGPSSGIPLVGDAELAVGRRLARDRGVDAAVWWSTEGRLVGVDDANVVVELDGRLCTPPTTDGALASAWRYRLVGSAGIDVVERSIADHEWMIDDGAVALWPWGAVSAIGGPDTAARHLGAISAAVGEDPR